MTVDRPRFHATPTSGWMNDPNGLVLWRGRYHLFFQHYPDDIVWGPMHWGHLVSDDLLRWEERPIALAPDEDGVVYSGSVVTQDDALVACYTCTAADGTQTQCLATSYDGDVWVKHPANPVLAGPEDQPDFRDPKLLRYDGAWVMVLAVGDEVWFYRSADFIDWRPTGRFGRGHGAHDGVWEMPDLFPIGDLWVLTVSVLEGGPAGGSGTQYFVGDFDGETFSTDQPAVRWVDHGPDFYAPQTFWGMAPTWVGWMSNWAYARDVPATTWRGVMSLPRTLDLVDGVLVQRPVSGAPIGSSLPAGVEVSRTGDLLVVDRTGGCPPGAPALITAPLTTDLPFEVVADSCSVEVFADGGRTVVTALVSGAPA